MSALALVLAVVCLPLSSSAAEEKGADPNAALLDKAIARFDKGEFDASKRLLLHAKGASHYPALLAKVHLYLGLHAMIAGDRRRAEQSFQTALSFDAELELDPQRFKPEFVEAFRRARGKASGSISVTADEASATVSVDGKAQGRVPFEERLSIGAHLVELRSASGERIFSKRLVLRAGEHSQVTVVVPRKPRPQVEPSHRAASVPISARRRRWAWVASGATAASLGIAIGYSAAALSDHRRGCSLVDPDGVGGCSAETTRTISSVDAERYEELRLSLERKRLIANIAWGLTGALAAASVVLFWWEGRPAPAERQERRTHEKVGALRWRAVPFGELGIGLRAAY